MILVSGLFILICRGILVLLWHTSLIHMIIFAGMLFFHLGLHEFLGST